MSSQDNSIIGFIFVLYLMISVGIFVISFLEFKNTPAHGLLVGLIINLFIVGGFISMGSGY